MGHSPPPMDDPTATYGQANCHKRTDAMNGRRGHCRHPCGNQQVHAAAVAKKRVNGCVTATNGCDRCVNTPIERINTNTDVPAWQNNVPARQNDKLTVSATMTAYDRHNRKLTINVFIRSTTIRSSHIPQTPTVTSSPNISPLEQTMLGQMIRTEEECEDYVRILTLFYSILFYSIVFLWHATSTFGVVWLVPLLLSYCSL